MKDNFNTSPFEGGLRGMTNRNLLKTITILLLALSPLLQSCKDIQAKNISGETPVLILPTSHDTVATNPIHFKWEAMEGATKYHLQIASPSFSNISEYVLDSIITTTDFYFQLDSNQYEMKLTAINAGYESITLGPVLFYVGVQGSSTPTPTANLTLTAPADSIYVNETFNGIFSWNAYTGATNYEMQLRKGSDYNTAQIIYTMTPGNTLSTTLQNPTLSPGIYSWRVNANSSNSSMLAQKIGYFFIDTLKPLTANLNTPANNGAITISDSVSFAWTTPSQTGSYQATNFSVLEISTTNNFSNILYSVTVYGTSKKLLLSSLNTGTVYYWRIRSKDEAGNESINPSTVFSFTAN